MDKHPCFITELYLDFGSCIEDLCPWNSGLVPVHSRDDLFSHIRVPPRLLSASPPCAVNTPGALHILGQKPINPQTSLFYICSKKKKRVEVTKCCKRVAKGPTEPTLNHTSESSAFHHRLIFLNYKAIKKGQQSKQHTYWIHTSLNTWGPVYMQILPLDSWQDYNKISTVLQFDTISTERP